MAEITLPNNIFFTGVPGSRWSGIAQIIESLPGFNTTDRTKGRKYNHSAYSGHCGTYFGKGMEFDSDPHDYNTDLGYRLPEAGCKLIKSHDWAYQLDIIDNCRVKRYDDWMVLVYRPDLVSQAWWHEAGGFNITYPNYKAYKNSRVMFSEIQLQNQNILEFAYDKKLQWSSFTAEWCNETFGHVPLKTIPQLKDVLVTVYKNV